MARFPDRVPESIYTQLPNSQGDHPMNTAVSADGTTIAFDRFGDGPPVIMAAGAFNTRAATEPLARALEQRFTVLN
jgi:hypothetical protein